MKFVVYIKGEIVIEADGVMQANSVWESLRKEGRPYIMGTCSMSVAAPDHQRHRASSETKITSMTKLARLEGGK